MIIPRGTTGTADDMRMAIDPYQTCPAPVDQLSSLRWQQGRRPNEAGGCHITSSREPRGGISTSSPCGVAYGRTGRAVRDHEEPLASSLHSCVSIDGQAGPTSMGFSSPVPAPPSSAALPGGFFSLPSKPIPPEIYPKTSYLLFHCVWVSRYTVDLANFSSSHKPHLGPTSASK